MGPGDRQDQKNLIKIILDIFKENMYHATISQLQMVGAIYE